MSVRNFCLTDECELQHEKCLTKDLPMAEAFDVSKLAGRWYFMFWKADESHGDNGVVEYEIQPSGVPRVHMGGSR